MERVITKKQREQIHKANKFYDTHMAGKFNPKEGEYNFTMSPTKKTILTPRANIIECECGNTVAITLSTKSFICGTCNKFIML